jgi:hypothetical protein
MFRISVIDNTGKLADEINSVRASSNAERHAIIGIWEEILNRNFAGLPGAIARLKESFGDFRSVNYLKSDLYRCLGSHLDGYPTTDREQIVNNLIFFYTNLQKLLMSYPKRPFRMPPIPLNAFVALKTHLISGVGINSVLDMWVALKLGYAIHLQTGITQGLPDPHPLLKILENIWTRCVSDIHPYQIGPTNQGTEHSMHNLETLNRINSLSMLDLSACPLPKGSSRTYISPPAPKRITMEEGVLLSAAAALHDIGKAVLPEKTKKGSPTSGPPMEIIHEKIGFQFIQSNHIALGIPEPTIATAIANIVYRHDGNQTLDSSTINDATISYTGRPANADPIRTRELCALFRLADVLDITFRRVSRIVKELNENHGKLDNRQKQALKARLCVDKVYFDPAHTDTAFLICNTKPIPVELENTILIENDKLENNTPSHNLKIQSLDGTGNVDIDIEDGSDARKILEPINAPYKLDISP